MTYSQSRDEEKIELYLEYFDAIDDVRQTFDERWGDFTDEWGAMLRELLTNAGVDTSEWIFRTKGSDFAVLFKEGWWRRTDDLSPIIDRPDDRNDVRIGFHLPEYPPYEMHKHRSAD